MNAVFSTQCFVLYAEIRITIFIWKSEELKESTTWKNDSSRNLAWTLKDANQETVSALCKTIYNTTF